MNLMTRPTPRYVQPLTFAGLRGYDKTKKSNGRSMPKLSPGKDKRCALAIPVPKPVTTVGRKEAEDTAGSEAKLCGDSALGARYELL